MQQALHMNRFSPPTIGTLEEETSRQPSKASILNALKACARLKDLEKGKAIDAAAVESGHASDAFVASALVDTYAKCRSMLNARIVFEGMQHRDVVSWTALIVGYADNGEGNQALDLLDRMVTQGKCEPNAVAFIAAFKACTSLAAREVPRRVGSKLIRMKALERGMDLHCKAENSKCASELKVANTLTGMYARCGSLADARKVFNGMEDPNFVSWNIIILGNAENGEGQMALELFDQMLNCCLPTSVTFLAALKACICLAEKETGKFVAGKLVKIVSLERGFRVQGASVDHGFDCETKVASALIDMFAKCGSLDHARVLFDRNYLHHRDAVTWNVLRLGYADNGQPNEALDLCWRMAREGCPPDSVTFVGALKACIVLAKEEAGKQVDGKLVKVESLDRGLSFHRRAVHYGCDGDIYVANTLVDMYAKCGSMVLARQVFDSMTQHASVDVPSWNVVIMGYADNGEGQEALQLFYSMVREGCKPDSVTFVAVLKACASVGALESGRAIHSDIFRRGLEGHVLVATSLVDFYGKCWCMSDARRVFDSLASKDTVAWTALLGGYSRHGDTLHVFDLFERMQQEKVKPNPVTFLCMLSACSHAGLVDQAMKCFESMSEYGISPGSDHYTCLVDLLGRANRLDTAVQLVKGMPFQPDAATWRAILCSCLKWRNVDLGRLAFQALLDLNQMDAPAYVLMTDIYRSMGMFQEQSTIQALSRIQLSKVEASCVKLY